MIDIKDYINTNYKPFDNKEKIAEAQFFLEKLNYSHYPVVDEEIFIGNISSEDIINFSPEMKIADYSYSFERFFARTSMIWFEVLEVFVKNQTNLVPVIDETNKYVGYYEIEEVVNFFYETPFFKESGSVISIQIKAIDYSMSQISQIIESNNCKIYGIFISDINNENIQITIKLNTESVNEIIQSFRNYNYKILSKHDQDDYINSLKERSNYLDKYLNI